MTRKRVVLAAVACAAALFATGCEKLKARDNLNKGVQAYKNAMQRLARRGLLTSLQGTRGGYRLARGSSLISVADIIQAIDGPFTVTACSTESENCDQYSKCSVRDPLWKIKDRIVSALATCSLQEISSGLSDTPATPMVFAASKGTSKQL